jgi:hypothetical protein
MLAFALEFAGSLREAMIGGDAPDASVAVDEN